MASDETFSALRRVELLPAGSRPDTRGGRIDPAILQLLGEYPVDCRPREIRCVGGAGGFSGARFWRILTDRGALCLRRWPVQKDPDWWGRLRFIHEVLKLVGARRAPPVPAPIRTRAHETILDAAGHLWELTPWMPGEADYFPLARGEKLRAALCALAEFHRAAGECRIPTGDFELPAKQAPSPGISLRRRQIDTLRSGKLKRIAEAIETSERSPTDEPQAWASLHQSAGQLLPLYCKLEEPTQRELVAAEHEKLPMQPCIRDIWHAHVLFEADRVSGLIDFGAMRIDNVSCDIARLLGSMAQDDGRGWQEGIAAYTAIRALTDAERRLIGVFDRSTTLLSGINWLEWLFVERRSFDDLQAISQRMSGIVERLKCLLDHGHPATD